MLAADDPAVGDDDSDAEASAPVDLPVMAVVARTGSRIIRRQSGRGFALDSPAAQGSSASVNRSGSVMQVVASSNCSPVVYAKRSFCLLAPFPHALQPLDVALAGRNPQPDNSSSPEVTLPLVFSMTHNSVDDSNFACSYRPGVPLKSQTTWLRFNRMLVNLLCTASHSCWGLPVCSTRAHSLGETKLGIAWRGRITQCESFQLELAERNT